MKNYVVTLRKGVYKGSRATKTGIKIMEINFEDYLSDDERKQIVADVFRQNCIDAWKKDGERLVGNIAFDCVLKMVNEAFDGDVKKAISENTIKAINQLSPFTVFAKADAWDRENSKGRDALNEAILNAKPLIKEKIESLINGLDEGELSNMLKDEAVYLLDTKLFGRAA